MFCRYCGNELNDNDNFCGKCGKSINESNLENTNNDKYNVLEILKQFKGDKVKTAVYLKQTYKLSLIDSKNLVDSTYKANANEINESQYAKKQQEKLKVEQLKDDKIPFCPKCHSTSLTAQKKGFGIGKAVIGSGIAGPLGLVAGNIGSKNVILTCLNCGYQFKHVK